MSTASLLPLPRAVFTDPNGAPLAGGFVYTYIPGGIVPKLTWQDAAETIPNSNPVTLDAAGSCLLYGSGIYQVTVTDSLGNQVPAYSGLTTDSGIVSPAMLPIVQAATVPAGLRLLLEPATNAPAVPIVITAAPAYTQGNNMNLSTAFDGDFSNPALTFSLSVTGVATLGQPTTGYQFNEPTCGIYGFAVNQSGWNNGTANSTGRTAICPVMVESQNLGQGDMLTFCARGVVAGAKAGATSWLANPAISLFAGDTYAGSDGVYLNPLEVQCVDQGFAVTAGGFVVDLSRTNAGQPLGQTWFGSRMQSIGSAAVDAAYNAVGPYNFGLDFTTATFTTADAIALKAGMRIDLNAANAGGFPNGTTDSNQYIAYNSGTGLVSVSNGASAVATLSSTVFGTNCPVSFGGNIFPGTDNAFTLGSASFRMSAIWAANGTIQTSDATLKTDIALLPAALPLLAAIEPKTWRWITGGNEPVTTMEEQDVPVTETQTRRTEVVTVVNGIPVLSLVDETVDVPVYDEVGMVDTAGAPVMVTIPGAREIRAPDGTVRQAVTAPRTVQRTHRVQRTERKQVPVTKLMPRPGRRTHWGFLAGDVKAAFAAVGVDFGGYVLGEDGTEGLRADQMVPVLWKAVQELAAEVSALKKV